jgi:hypothetical protein
MEKAPTFFLPDSAPAEEETTYARYAEACYLIPPPPLGQRIYSITWKHNGEEWTATVGQCLRGIRRKKASRGRPARQEPLSDAAVVQAIFPGVTYRVVTNSAYGSQWVNPLLAGVPTSITLFSR